MNEQRINEIMRDITEDGNLCIIREALRQFKEEEVEEGIESEESFASTYERIKND